MPMPVRVLTPIPMPRPSGTRVERLGPFASFVDFCSRLEHRLWRRQSLCFLRLELVKPRRSRSSARSGAAKASVRSDDDDVSFGCLCSVWRCGVGCCCWCCCLCSERCQDGRPLPVPHAVTRCPSEKEFGNLGLRLNPRPEKIFRPTECAEGPAPVPLARADRRRDDWDFASDFAKLQDAQPSLSSESVGGVAGPDRCSPFRSLIVVGAPLDDRDCSPMYSHANATSFEQLYLGVEVLAVLGAHSSCRRISEAGGILLPLAVVAIVIVS